MKSRSRLSWLSGRAKISATLIVLFLAAPAAPMASGQVPTFVGRTDLVSVDVSVRRGDRPVTGLKIADFQIFDNGVPQTVADLTYGKLPIDVTVLFDASQSVTGEIFNVLKEATQELGGRLADQDRLKLVEFGSRVILLRDFGAGGRELSSAFGQVRDLGRTAIFDAIAIELARPPTPNRRQLIVVFTDGDDNSSVTQPSVLLDIARRTAPTVAIVLASFRTGAVVSSFESAAGGQARLQPVYEALGGESGGFVATTRKGDDLRDTFRRVLDRFRSTYVVHFVPRGVKGSGVHSLRVRVDRPDATVRARTSYAW